MIRPISVPKDQMDAFCRRWMVSELSLSTRSGEREEPVGVYVRFDPRADWSLVDRIRMQEELRKLSGRHIALHNRHSVELRKGAHTRGRLLFDA